MRFIEFIKRHSTVIISVSAVLYAIAVSAAIFIGFILSIPHGDGDIHADKAISIVKRFYECEKILWVGDNIELCKEPYEEIYQKISRSHYAYYVVGERAGSEVLIVVPSDLDLNKPFIATWAFNYSFKEIVAKFNENGANYTADVPDDYYGVPFSSYIGFETTDWAINDYADYYDVGCDGEEFYERLDVKAVFKYQWVDDNFVYRCIVAQENGELKAYKTVENKYAQ